MSPRPLLALVLASATVLGCSLDFGDDPPPPPPPPPAIPPRLDPLTIPDYPPLGPKGSIPAHCVDEAGIQSVTATFKHSVPRFVSGLASTVSFTGQELGEGMGTLRIVCCDSSLVCVERTVTSFLVDLSPPQIEVDRVIASPRGEDFDGEIGIWVRDAWVLGTVELTFRGKKLVNELPKAYPSTLGKDWDVTRIGFPARDLPLGSGTAIIVAHDAAGNVAEREVAIRIDGTAPTVSIVEAVPTPGRIHVRVAAADVDNPTSPTIDVYAGGAPVAELSGPQGEIDIDTSTFPPGPIEIRAVAQDDAGNRSPPAKTVVTVP